MRNLPLEPVLDFRRREIGALLRSRRSALRPSDVGLPQRSGRRVGGLRMEDVAELAGVSLSLYAHLEAGRQTRISPQSLAAVARALRLLPYEMRHLLMLTTTPMLHEDDGSPVLLDDVRAIVESSGMVPAIAVDRYFELFAANASARQIFAIRGNEEGFAKKWRVANVLPTAFPVSSWGHLGIAGSPHGRQLACRVCSLLWRRVSRGPHCRIVGEQ